MADLESRSRRSIKDIVEESKYWDAEELMQNLDEELERMERGFGHVVFDMDDRLVTKYLRPMPATPTFEEESDEANMKVRVNLPGMHKDHIRVNVDKDSIEIVACSEDHICRPYHLSVEADGVLEPETARAEFNKGVLEVSVAKVKKRRLKVR